MKPIGLQKAIQLAARHREATKRPAFEAKKAGERGELYIYDSIGADFWSGGGVTAQSVQKALADLKGVTGLDIYVNSPGGDIFEGKAIHSQIRRFAVAERVVHVDGIAASAATFIAMAGDRIITAPSATWMVHEVSGGAWGRAEDMRAMADLLEQENRVYAETYAERTGKPVEECLALMNDETWMTAAEALEHGFTDEVADPGEDAETEDEEKAAAATAPLLRLAAQTAQRVALARQGHRLNQLSRRASPSGRAASRAPTRS